MNHKKRPFIISLIFFVILISSFSGAQTSIGEEWGNEGSDEKTPAEQAQNAISNGGDYSGSVPANTQINLPGGGSATVSGNVVVSGGKITQADSISYSGATAKGVNNFEASGDGFSIAEANEVNHAGSIIRNARGLKYTSGILTAESYSSYTKPNAITTNGINLKAAENQISVSKADNLFSGRIIFNDITDASFSIFDDAVLAKPGLNTNLSITDEAGNQAVFEAISNDSSLIITKSAPPVYIIDKGILTCAYDGKKDALISNSTSTVRMGMACFECMKINPIGTYWYVENYIKDFGVHIPIESEEYTLCLKKPGYVNLTNYDGLVDFVGRSIMLDGTLQYQRYLFDNNQLVSLLSGNVYISKSLNHAFMSLDNNFEMVDRIEITPERNRTAAITKNSYFQINEHAQARRTLNISKQRYPEVIKEYKTTDIDNPVYFNQANFGIVLTQENRIKNGYVVVYPPTPSTKLLFSGLMQRSYQERNI